jgi:hypothetical protein
VDLRKGAVMAATIEYTELDELGDDIFTCKMLWAHAWDKNPTPKHIDGAVARIAYRILCLRCRRCRRERYDYLGRHGELIGRYYRDPIGYPKTRRANGDAMRTELIRRSLWVQEWNNGSTETSRTRKKATK